MFRKITRIFFKCLAVIFVTLILLLIGLYFGIQSYTFQTWLGRKVSAYISTELETKVSIDAIQLDLFKKAKLKGVIILDQKQDTLIFGNLNLDIKNFDYKNESLSLKNITLENTTIKLAKYKNEKDLNFQFLVNYFSSDKVTRTKIKKKGWDIVFGDIVLNNLTFAYRDDNGNTKISKNMNFENLYFKNTYGTFSNLKLDNEVIEVGIKNFKTREQCGFELNNLTTLAKVSSIEVLLDKLYLKTPKTLLRGSIHFNSNEWNDYAEFIDKIKMDVKLLDNSKICFSDIATFTSELNGLDETIYLSGKIYGFVSDLHLTKFKLKYRNNTKFDGDLSLSGLPVFSTTYLSFDAKEISTNYYDLIQFPNYPFTENKKLELPTQLKPIGTMAYKGKFEGFINDFTSTGLLNTAIGKVYIDMAIKLGKNTDDIQYLGKIKTEGLNLGIVTGISNLSNLTINTEIKGKGVSLKALDASLNGQVITCNYNGYVYNNIKLKGDFKNQLFNGEIVSSDPNANFDFNGKINFKNKVPEMDFISSINNLNLSVLNLVPNSKADSGIFSSQVLINLKGDNLDNLSGLINFDDTKYKTKTKYYKLSSLNLDINQVSENKNIKLSSAYLNASAEGVFKLSNLQPAFEEFLSNYYPTFLKKEIVQKKYEDKITFKANVKNFKTISELFIPDLMISNGTLLNGNVDIAAKSFSTDIISKEIKYNGIVFDNLSINSHEENNIITAKISGSDLKLTDSIVLKNFNLCISTQDKETKYNFEWDNLIKPSNKGEIAGHVVFDNSAILIKHDTVTVTARDSTWQLLVSNPTIIDSSGMVTFNPLLFGSNNQRIGIAGILSDKETQNLVVNTSGVVLEQFNPLLQSSGLKLEGVLSGSVAMHSVLKNPIFSSDLDIVKLRINNNYLGELGLKNEYNSKDKYVYLDGFTSVGLLNQFGMPQKNIAFNGYYYLDKREEAIDIDFACTPANLKLLNPYLTDIITIKSALVKGKGKVHGSPSNIKIEGKLNMYQSEIKVDYTNVTYNITGDIEIMPDQIRFSEMKMSVPTSTTKSSFQNTSNTVPQGTINGNFFHSNFTKMQIDYDVSYKNMLVLNTTEKENKDFYGKIYGTGMVGIYGFFNDLHMEVRTTTNKNSKLVLPMDGPSEIGENDFIHFVRKDTIKKEEEKISGFNLDMVINATPDAQTKIILDNKTGDGLNIKGYGDIAMKINTLGKFEMIGDYFITDGEYVFTLENVINKKFDIDAGSMVSWSGDPLGAELNISTSYKQRASVAPLLNGDSSYKSRVPVDCKLIITDKLFSPKISFRIDAPTIDANGKSRIANILSDDAELNRQVFSFLLFRTFVTPAIYNTNTGGVSAGSAAASAGSEMLSNRLSSFLNNYVGNLTGIKDLNVGLNYRTGNQNTGGQAVDLALSKQFLNNKISVDGNFGVNNNQSTGNTSSLIGDVNVDYKLSDDGRFRVKGFNRTNNSTQVSTSGGPFTQGVGLFYRLEFERLFKRQLEEEKKKKNSNP
ncbi:MAG: translocation/assembly module TamB domain-containing protein [Bacteroidota bacterium]|nr:translocation/assembly module TamB domain-containing protein [Bacteroidota bacterium]